VPIVLLNIINNYKKIIIISNTVILSNFRRTRTVLYFNRTSYFIIILSYQTQTELFLNETRVRGVESNHRTIIKNLKLILKTRETREKYNTITQNKQYILVFF
jgi:hypothetical protein